MKLIIKIFISVLTVILMANSIFAANIELNKKIQDLKIRDSIYTHVEKDIVLSICSDFSEEVKNQLIDLSEEKIEKDEVKIFVENMYKVYSVSSNSMVQQYKSGVAFNSLLKEEYEWEIPIFNNGKAKSTFTILKSPLLRDIPNVSKLKQETLNDLKKNEGKWVLAKIGNSCSTSGIEMFLSETSLNDLLIKNNIADLSDLKIVNIPYYFTYIIYLNSQGKDYAVPFTKREDIVGIKNGILYNMDELMDIFITKFSSESKTAGAKYGGVAQSTSKNVFNTITYVSISLASISILVALVFLLKRKSQSN